MRASLVFWMSVLVAARAPGVDPVPPALPAPANSAPAVGTAALFGPRADFAEMIHDFGKIQAGAVVRHDFVFTNTGTATLKIAEVRPGCGCTTAGAWDKEVEPGMTGKIPIQFNAGSFSGNVGKSISVTCNDVVRSNVLLQLRAHVWTAVAVTPASLYFTVNEETATNETKVVRIANNLEEDLKLSEPVLTNTSFRASLVTVKPGKEFELHVTPVLPLPTSYAIGSVSIRTSSEKVPNLNIPVSASMQPTISVFPSVLTLSARSGAVPVRSVVTLRNSGSRNLALSDPRIDIPGATVDVNELQPGRLFRLTLNVPPDAAPKAGQSLELSVASDHPKHPRIRVPVRWVASLPSPGAVTAATVTNRTVPAVLPLPAPGVPAPPAPVR